MAGKFQPLNQDFAIVKANGLPTEYFIRWAQQRQIDITTAVTFGDLAAINVIAGVGLTGGGPIDADVTVDLEDTGVAPGTYGDATHVAQIQIDAQGRILTAADVAISGGGGGGAFGEFAYGPPTIAGLATVVSPGGPTVTSADFAGKGLGIALVAAAGGRGTARFQAAPATPFCAVLRISGFAGIAAGGTPFEMGFGIALRNSANGRMLYAYKYSDGNIYLQQWADPQTFNAGLATGPSAPNFLAPPNYFAVSITALNVIQFYYSNNGVHWEPFGGTIALGTYILAVDQVGISMFTENTAGKTAYTLSEFWRVDATIPPALAL